MNTLLLAQIPHATYGWCLLTGLLGLAFYLFAVKIPSALEKAKAANQPTTVWNYLSHDWASIAASLAAIILAVICLDELIRWKPELLGSIKIIYGFFGFTGTVLLIALFGKFNGLINTVIDIKTDISDGKISPDTFVPTINKTAAVG